MKALRTTVECLDGCGPLGDGRTGDPPDDPKPPPNWKGPLGDGTWTRWDELDRLAEAHPHPTRTTTTPEATR